MIPFDKQEIEFVDLMINYIKENKYSKRNDLWIYLSKNGCNDNKKFETLFHSLTKDNEYGLINIRLDRILLTVLGEYIYKIGFENYLKKLERDETLDRYSKEIAIRNSKYSLRISIIAIILSVLIPIIIFLVDKIYFTESKGETIQQNKEQPINDLSKENDLIPVLNKDTITMKNQNDSINNEKKPNKN